MKTVPITYTPQEGSSLPERRGLRLDSKLVSLTSKLFGAASSASSLIGGVDSLYIPCLSIVALPFYLYSGIQQGRKHFNTMKAAYKSKKVADLFFWAFRGVGDIGTTLSDVIKPFTGGIKLLRFDQMAAPKFIFGTFFPILIIILNVFGGISQGLALKRSARYYKEFNLKNGEYTPSVENAKKLLTFMAGEADSVERSNFQDAIYTSSKRREFLEMRLEKALIFCDKVNDEGGEGETF